MRTRMIERFLKKRGLKVSPAEDLASRATSEAALERLRARKIPVRSIIDVGASDGRWTADVMRHYPTARFLCVEAQAAHERGLKALVAQNPRVDYAICAAGDKPGEIAFDASDLFGGIAMKVASGSHCITVPVKTIDDLITERQLPPPYLIKLDTHGYELPILAGAARALKDTEVLIAEVYNFPGGPPAVPFYEFCRVVAGLGFRCLDLFDPLYREYDDAFWQMDMIFVKATRHEFQYGAFV